MKNIIVALLLFFSLSMNAQSWVKCQVDENMCIQMPTGYKMNDTLGMRLISYQNNDEYIIIVKEPYEEYLRTVRPDDLNAVYRKFRHGMLNTADRNLIAEKSYTKKGLKWKYFSFTALWHGAPEIQHYAVLLLNGMLYTINYVESQASDYTAMRQKEFFASIKTKTGLKVSDQLMHKSKKI